MFSFAEALTSRSASLLYQSIRHEVKLSMRKTFLFIRYLCMQRNYKSPLARVTLKIAINASRHIAKVSRLIITKHERRCGGG